MVFFRCKVCFANHHNDVKCKHDPRRDSNISTERLGCSEWPLVVCLEAVYESEEIEWREGRMQDAFEGIINVQQSAYVGTWITASLVLKQTVKEKRSFGSPAADHRRNNASNCSRAFCHCGGLHYLLNIFSNTKAISRFPAKKRRKTGRCGG